MMSFSTQKSITARESTTGLFRTTKGAEINYDRRNNVYILERSGSFKVKIDITRQEAEALLLGLNMAGHFLPHLKKAAKSLWKKLDTYISHDISREVQAGMMRISLPAAEVDSKIFESLLDAIRHRHSYFRGNSWYLAAYNHVFRNISIYRARRILNVNAFSEKYITPKESGYSEEYIASAWHVMPGPAKHRIKLYVSKYLAESVCDLGLHPTQIIEECEDGGIILTAEVPNLEEAARWIMASAPGVRVLEPDELQDIVKEYCLGLLAH